jgi:hypothetical protein
VVKSERRVAKLGRRVAKLGRWVAKLVARLLAKTAALWVRIQTSLIIQNGRYKQRSGQYTLDCHKNIQKKFPDPGSNPYFCNSFLS